VVEVYSDAGISGAKGRNGRPGLDSMLKDASRRKFDVVMVPLEHKVEHSNSLKNMTDEQLEQAIEMVKQMLEARAGDGAKVIEGTAEPVGMLGCPLIMREARGIFAR
jgi:hypothetical protein